MVAYSVEVLIFELAALVLYSVACSIGRGAISYAVAQTYLHKTYSTKECLQWGWKRVCALFTSGLIVGAALGLFMIVAFGIQLVFAKTANSSILFGLFWILAWVAIIVVIFYTSIKLMLAFPAITLEGKGAVDGLKRSWDLTRGGFCFLFCSFSIAQVAGSIVKQVFAGLMTIGAKGDILRTLVGSTLSLTIPGLLSFPLLSILEVIVYMHFRVHKEGFSADVLHHDLTGQVSLHDGDTGAYSSVPFKEDDNDERGVPLVAPSANPESLEVL